MNLKRHATYMVLSWSLLGAFLLLSNPNELPVVVLIVPFLLLFVALYSVWNIVRELGAHYSMQSKPRRHLGLAVCISAVLLLVLQSLGQLTLRDVVTVAAIVIVGFLYLGRTSIQLPHR